MRRYLVVAHRTLGGEHLFDHMRMLRAEGPCRFHFLVPVEHPADHSWSDGEIEAAANERLKEILEISAEMGIGADGEVGDANPVYAVGVVLRREHDGFAGIVVSTLPKTTSRWWRLEVPRRISSAYPHIPMVHLVDERVLV